MIPLKPLAKPIQIFLSAAFSLVGVANAEEGEI
jgi:hypothetical protein